jgi:hypothetical protein
MVRYRSVQPVLAGAPAAAGYAVESFGDGYDGYGDVYYGEDGGDGGLGGDLMGDGDAQVERVQGSHDGDDADDYAPEEFPVYEES